ncbi:MULTISPECIES: uridine diphosphate-N-acetylglucosamine-binding protein YvcK [unclassified Arthrobacter]|uniref:gluconeogenesis factor YvcK family protein n=1 Tax=unclassified Arthrobacter TaxID=235627 RepID=UPI00254FD1C5|nr:MULTISPECIES: uridine diphosphate-N-acetylglucosamine-binding protein YvcK [unclassified Arthrobacter]
MGVLTGPLPLIPPKGVPGSQQKKSPSVVALGGGHGLAASLSALRLLTSELTAIVTVADDGGSSGRLRDEYGVLPPGDLRMALSALCDDTDWGRTWRDVMQHRFDTGSAKGGSLDHHAMGNLLIVTLWELLGDAVAGLKWAGALLGARGQVLPMSSVPLTIEGHARVDLGDGRHELQLVRGQAKCAVAGKLEDVRLLPEDAPACTEALTAIELADWVILGPGSWYTSVLPHLLLPELRQALGDTAAKRCLTMNLDVETKETSGMTAADHLDVLRRYAPEFSVDVVLADPAAIQDLKAFEKAAGMIGAEVVLGRVGASRRRPVHDPLLLAAAYHDIFGNS